MPSTIVFRLDSSWRGVYNIDEATFYGASMDGRVTFTEWLSGNGSVTWQQSKKDGDIFDMAGLSDEIDYLPDWKASLGLEFKLPFKSVFNVALRYVGERRAIYAYRSGWPAQQYFKQVTLDDHLTTDLCLTVPVGSHAEVSG